MCTDTTRNTDQTGRLAKRNLPNAALSLFNQTVKHSYIERVGDWPCSTFHTLVRRAAYPSDWGGDVDDFSLGWPGQPYGRLRFVNLPLC